MGGHARWELPADVVERWVDSYGQDAVRRWLVDCRALAARCGEAWRLRIDGFLPGGSLSCVLACHRADGSRAVLKLLAPWAEDAIASEGLALAAWEGCGVVTLLERTPDGRALLLSRVSPGRSFAPSGNDANDCERVAQMLRVLVLAPVPAGLPALSEAVRARYARARDAGQHRRAWITAQALDGAERRAVELARAATRKMAVHGDAQNKNLLVDDDGGGSLVGIDPEPSVGDPHFDPALWAVTHRPGDGVRERCAVLGGLLGLDAAQLWSWCLVLAVAEVALEVPDRALAQRALILRVSSWALG
jgi:streptomycin 6-kinase